MIRTRLDILEEYKVDENGIIRSPGKFVDEPFWVVYFFDLLLNRLGKPVYSEELDSLETIFDVTPEVLTEFPELKDVREVALSESSAGFVYVRSIPRV